MNAHRIYVEKYSQFQVEAQSLKSEFNENLSLSLRTLRLLNVYDLFGFSSELLEKCRYTVFGETVTDTVTDECPLEGKKYLAVEYIPGQQYRVHALFLDDTADFPEEKALILFETAGLKAHPQVPVRSVQKFHALTLFCFSLGRLYHFRPRL